MECKITNRSELIENYLRRELPENEMNSFEEHFLNCNKCFAELQLTQQLMGFIKSESKELFPEYLHISKTKETFSLVEYVKNLLSIRWAIKPGLSYAFAIAFSGLIIITIYNTTFNNDSANSLNTGQTEQLSSNFIESPDLESIINQEFRSEEVLKVLSPKVGEEVKNKLTFKWNSTTSEKLTIKILSNKEDLLAESTPVNNEYELDVVANNYKAGLYYWKLESKDNLLYVGKFFVK
ncbi:MAG: hypothetical protein CVV23_16950 [Ignavibacteriae bacterium HGW-Ignavibacteriae-2]|jgi:hypothetical protein|nr:zf-HC2 domain-containing protein [Bacteroidota bacterium]PKL87134.1 MAG: hypothetical protein CVV23_16950 [Ignavibacteriae bacterium HGW-Ignavibacteriae-2]